MLRSTVALLVLSTAVASAQDLGAPMISTQDVVSTQGTVSSQGTGPAIGFTLRGGVESAPEYFGSADNEAGPALAGSLNYLRLGGFTFGNPDPLYLPEGFGINGSFRYIGDRDDADNPELSGLDDVDASLELGGGLRYSTRAYQVFGNLRYGVIGHEAIVGELGADVLVRPTDRLTLRMGPRALFGDGDYASTYFGVTEAENVASAGNFAAFDPEGGLMSTSVELGAGYRLTDNWGIDATVSYERLRDDAARSPIVQDDDQVRASIGVTRRFSFGF